MSFSITCLRVVCGLTTGFGAGCSASSLGIGTFFTCSNANEKHALNLEYNKKMGYIQLSITTYQISILEIKEHLDVSLLCLFLLFVQLPPESISAPHVQHLVCIYLPSVATKFRYLVNFNTLGEGVCCLILHRQ